MHPFAKINLDKWIQKTCDKLGYETPTKIQEMAIPSLLKKKDVLINAETGSGKTATFGFPILQELAKDPYGILALIITPSRELAMQIGEQMQAFGQSINLKCACLVGGMDMIKQITELERIPHIVVGTPGRIVDMMSKSPVFMEYIENLQTLVLDEADRLLERSIFPVVQDILEKLPKKKQIVLATATVNEYFTDEKISEYLDQEIKLERFTQNDQKILVSTLKQVNILVATDVVSRGLDIPFVQLVINYDIPQNQEDYVHRVGRTARKGKRGFACSFVTQVDVQLLLEIEKYTGEKMTEYEIDEKAALEEMPMIQKAKKSIKLKQHESGVEDNFNKEEKQKQQYKQRVKQKRLQKQQQKDDLKKSNLYQQLTN
ncbi:P-loop containing nucleoside triphosphate hydrolase [Pseudocohnilembus persalinus]|uniref:p-loop containing nucleoside triphosphate hydrolase n=1 Tax=Pseudocohnilembus persalinus TaxID=266149 RepID=A0A0V0R441_PSEPJ|nr:P-loop containing nucleoside triphosphate hydrolase [Pseudocohnilembus persalinus]|eukprot:KRX09254.1 P-loop containing nucleoside triphosphate hydrolase [Pseudocohnilembus persalinus]